VALAIDITVFPAAVVFMCSMYYLTWRALQGACVEGGRMREKRPSHHRLDPVLLLLLDTP